MSFLLDTNTCIVYLNGRSQSVRQKLETLSPREVLVCSVVKAELFYGAMKSINPERTLAGQQLFLNRFVSLKFDDAAAEAYSRIRAELDRAGKPIGPNDLMIAAIAVSNELTLVTHNRREFDRVLGLRCEDWEEA
jgi:tRNA(fMet)-specific endonuclease VapC